MDAMKRGSYRSWRPRWTPLLALLLLSSTSCDDPADDDDSSTPEVDCRDDDRDGFAVGTTCVDTSPQDCDDEAPSVFPGADEICNGVDDSCDGVSDEGFDGDGDGYLDGDDLGCAATYDQDDLDCDDGDTEIHPGADEACNGLDDDCDGEVDDGFDGDGDGWSTCPRADSQPTATTPQPRSTPGNPTTATT
jgi:hypothetical protein